jgi:hypothetical protein
VKCEAGYGQQCACGVWNNYGAPSVISVGFNGFSIFSGATRSCSSQCGLLNDSTSDAEGQGPFNCNFQGQSGSGTCSWESATIAVWDPLGDASGVYVSVEVGYDPTGNGIWCSIGIVGATSGASYLLWQFTNLPVPPGLLGCDGETQVPTAYTLGHLLGQAFAAGKYTFTQTPFSGAPGWPTDSNGHQWLCHTCLNASSPGDPGAAGAGAIDSGVATCWGGGLTAPPCCCGGQNSHQNPGCFICCFSCNGTNSPTCQLCGVAITLCPQGSNQWTGQGTSTDGQTISAILSNSDGNWALTYACDNGSPQNVPLNASTDGNLTLTGTTNGATVTITNGQMVSCPGGNLSTCLPYTPASVLVTLPALSGIPTIGVCGPPNSVFSTCCQNIGGTYALDYGARIVGACPTGPDCNAYSTCSADSPPGAVTWATPVTVCSGSVTFNGRPCPYLWTGGLLFAVCCDGTLNLQLCWQDTVSSCCHPATGSAWGCTKVPLSEIRPGAVFDLVCYFQYNNDCLYYGTIATVEFI